VVRAEDVLKYHPAIPPPEDLSHREKAALHKTFGNARVAGRDLLGLAQPVGFLNEGRRNLVSLLPAELHQLEFRFVQVTRVTGAGPPGSWVAVVTRSRLNLDHTRCRQLGPNPIPFGARRVNSVCTTANCKRCGPPRDDRG